MASAPQAQGLPLLYSDLVPLSSNDHGTWKVRSLNSLDFVKKVHAIPLTVEEFAMAQRHYPIVFAAGSDPVPLALMGLNDDVNVFINDEGVLLPDIYLPAYIRRYPFLLARLRPDSEEMTLCFDPTLGLIGDFEDGIPLFENGEPTQQLKDTLGFCEQFEIAAQKTGAFCRDLIEAGLLEDGEVTIEHPSSPAPYIYRGFQMVSEEKLRNLRGDQLRKMNQNGLLMLVHAHLFSLGLMTNIFAMQMQQGKVPQQTPSIGA